MISALVVSALLAGAESPDPVLVEAIVQREARVAALHQSCAFTTTKRTESLGAKGRVISWSETVERVVHRDGVMSREVVRHVVDGHDRTESMHGQGGSSELEMAAPFSAASRNDYRFLALAPDPVTGWARIAFEPKRDKGDAARGTVSVEPQTGSIRRMEYEPEHPGALVQQMKVSMEFDAPSPEGPALSCVRVAARGGVLFVKKRMRVTVEFSDYEFPDRTRTKEDDGSPAHHR